jgi:hypothetical protein
LAEIADDLPPITWFWSDWIPNGMITLLGSAPGIGKSFFALDLARRVIHGMAFPDGSATPRPGAAVIYVDAELVPQMMSDGGWTLLGFTCSIRRSVPLLILVNNSIVIG